MRRAVLSALCAVLFGGAAQAAPPAPPSVSLPDAGTYSLWVQAKTGSVSLLPTTVTHKKTVPLPGAQAGDTLYVLDAHTGNVATRAVAAGAPLALAVSDFRPLAAPATPVVKEAAPEAPAAPNNGGAGGNRASGVGQFVSWLLGLALAAGVVWLLVRMVQTRGEPLVALARRVGIDVPDPKTLDPNAATMPVYQPPKPRAVEAIPDDAGLPPTPATARRSPFAPPVSSATVPQLVGLEGLAAGSTFALAMGDTTVGREGGNDIVLAEDSVSRRHARLTRAEDGGIHLTDDGSANGVFVNGRRVQDVLLVPGDEIRIGDNAFRYEAPVP